MFVDSVDPGLSPASPGSSSPDGRGDTVCPCRNTVPSCAILHVLLADTRFCSCPSVEWS